MKRCPKCNNDFSDDANFCPVDAGHLVPIPVDGTPVPIAKVDTGGHELLAGRFALGDIVGGHRTGPVYQAGDKQGTTAMVKVIDASVFPTSLLKQRMERSLTQLENLEHVNVAKVLGHGRREDAIWLATERVDGVTLDAFVAASGPISQTRALKILQQIGSGLEAASKLGVIHRDLSPKNILVAENDQVKIINFGIPVPSDASYQGVVEFIAPEQVEGRAVDQRSLIYSLGAIAYVLLTGQPPFTGSAADVIVAHNSGNVRILGEKEGVSRDLSNVLVKALEKSSSKRFMTLRQFLGGLENVDESAPIAAAAGKKPIVNAGKTLMGLAPVDGAAAAAAMQTQRENVVGTPAPAEPGGTKDLPVAANRVPPVADSAQTTIDNSAPEMTPEVIAAAQNSAVPNVDLAATTPDSTALQAAVAGQSPAGPAPVVAMAESPQPVTGPTTPAAAALPIMDVKPGGKGKSAGKKPVKKSSSSNKGKFRETMWFKKGELDEAAAKAAAQAKPEDRVSTKADEMEMDERYKDDGSITQTDKERLSLSTGSTMMMEAIPEQAKPASRVSEADLVSEMTGGRNKALMAIAAVVVIAAGIAAALLLT